MPGRTRTIRNVLPNEVVFAALPGPTRKRTASAYCYRLTYKGEAGEAGCAMQWDVLGGREVYQVALERLPGGRTRWHCTCADATYRADGRHVCKHVRGLLEQGRKPTAEVALPG